MKQQTSVEILVEKLKESGITFMKDELEMIKQAKELHKEELKDTFIEGSLISKYINFENYYTIKFNNETI